MREEILTSVGRFPIKIRIDPSIPDTETSVKVGNVVTIRTGAVDIVIIIIIMIIITVCSFCVCNCKIYGGVNLVDIFKEFV